MTKTQIKKNYDIYLKSSITSLEEIYTKPSLLKKEAIKDCLKHMELNDGYRGRIVTANVDMFTFGYLSKNPDTNEILFTYITKYNIYNYPVKELID